MRISLIAAMSQNRVIGHQGKLPWHLPADLKHFKCLTLGKPLIMGRKTFDSIGKPLPGRTMIIMTRALNYQAPSGCLVVHSLEDGLTYAQKQNPEEVFIAGGGEIYRQALAIADYLYLTLIDTSIEGDTFFPHWSADDWKEIERTDHPPAEHAPGYSFVTWARTQKR